MGFERLDVKLRTYIVLPRILASSEASPPGPRINSQTQPPQPITCPGGSPADANGNCFQTTNQQPLSPFTQTQQPITCPDGSTPDANGNCFQTTNQPSSPSMPQICSDGSTPVNGICPTTKQLSPTCPGGSPPDANGNCPPTNPNLNQTPCIDNPAVGSICPTSPPPPTQQPTLCPDGSQPAADGSCPSPPPPAQQPVNPCIQDPSAPGCSTTPTPYSWYGSSNERQEST
jgi:hypothetical protein